MGGADFHRDDLMSVSSQASRFSSDIILSYMESEHEHRVDVKSLLGMALLPIRYGSVVRLMRGWGITLNCQERMDLPKRRLLRGAS